MKSIAHAAAGVLATLTIFIFLSATISSEIFGTYEQIAMVKRSILLPGVLILIPLIAMTGGTGFSLSKVKRGRVVQRKLKRMPFVALNGVLILIPSAVVLNYWASQGSFNTWFYLVQGIEIVAGFVNLTLLGLNIRDGFRLKGRSIMRKGRPKTA